MVHPLQITKAVFSIAQIYKNKELGHKYLDTTTSLCITHEAYRPQK